MKIQQTNAPSGSATWLRRGKLGTFPRLNPIATLVNRDGQTITSFEECGGIRRIALDLFRIERDAEAWLHRNLKITPIVEPEWLAEKAVDIGAAADELDKIDMREGGGKLKVGGNADCGVPAVADIFD